MKDTTVNNIRPWTDQHWSISQLEISEKDYFSGVNRSQEVFFGSVTILFLILLTLYFNKIIAAFSSGLFSVTHSKSSFVSSAYRLSLRLMTLFIIVPLFVILLIFYLIQTTGIIDNMILMYLYTMLGVSGLLIVKTFIMRIIGWVSGNKEFWGRLTDTFYLLVIALFALSIVPVPIMFLFEIQAVNIVVIYLACSLILSMLVYTFYIMRQIIAERLRLFFGFLYLCTLEILPAALIIKAFLQY